MKWGGGIGLHADDNKNSTEPHPLTNTIYYLQITIIEVGIGLSKYSPDDHYYQLLIYKTHHHEVAVNC